jgi:hypothetical protein
MKIRLIAVIAVSLGILAGCGTPAPSSAPAAPAPTPVSIPAPPAPAAQVPVVTDGVAPASLTISSIGATSTLIPVGLTADGALDVPSVHTPKQAAWFQPGPEPGQNGPAVIIGHIDGDHIEGVFWKLKDVHAGDVVQVVLKDGRQLRFTVYATELASKDSFPASKVFGFTPTPELRLITCGGSFDAAAHSYRSNSIVYARLVP